LFSHWHYLSDHSIVYTLIPSMSSAEEPKAKKAKTTEKKEAED